MKFIAAFLTVFLFCTGAGAQDADFRGFVWGVGKEDVRRFERAALYKEEGGSLYFVEKAQGEMRRVIQYDFENEKLARIQTYYPEYHEASPDPVLDRIAAKTAEMSEVYGAPNRERLIWNDETYQYYPQFWGRALRRGDLRFESAWETATSVIRLESYHDGDYYQIRTIAQSKALAGRIRKEDEGILLLAP